MNLYLRYFDKETLVYNVEEALAFLMSIDEIDMTPELENDVREYVSSNVLYPKRYKIRPRVYFIIIKTEAANMQDFKDKKALHQGKNTDNSEKNVIPAVAVLNKEQEGWYQGMVDFKRVALVPETGKFQYRDARFIANVKAVSGLDCYNKIIAHLKQRVDERSQFPSAKGKNFQFRFLGLAK